MRFNKGMGFANALSIEGFDLAAASKDRGGSAALGGRASISSEVDAELTGANQLPARLNGKWRFNVHNGFYQSRDKDGQLKGKPTRFDAAGSSGAITNGIAKSGDFYLKGQDLTVTGGGWIDLNSETLDCNFTVNMRKQMKNSQPIDVEYRTRTKNGALIWLYHKGSVVNIEHGRSYIQSIVFDITRNKEAALSKRISDERYQFILEQHDINIFEQNLVNGYFSCSAQWLHTFGAVFNILENDPAIPLFPDDQERLVAFQKEVRLAPHQYKCTLEARLRDAEGEYRWFRIEASNIANTQGSPIYSIGIITDIDKQKSLELQLRTQATRDSGTGMRNKMSTEKAVSQFLETHESPLPQFYAM